MDTHSYTCWCHLLIANSHSFTCPSVSLNQKATSHITKQPHTQCLLSTTLWSCWVIMNIQTILHFTEICTELSHNVTTQKSNNTIVRNIKTYVHNRLQYMQTISLFLTAARGKHWLYQPITVCGLLWAKQFMVNPAHSTTCTSTAGVNGNCPHLQFTCYTWCTTKLRWTDNNTQVTYRCEDELSGFINLEGDYVGCRPSTQYEHYWRLLSITPLGVYSIKPVTPWSHCCNDILKSITYAVTEL